MMDKSVLLALLEADLDLLDPPEERVTQLGHLLDSAREMICREGIVLTDDADEDIQLVVMYAAWLYRKRASADTDMPRMLRYALNNRLFAGKMG